MDNKPSTNRSRFPRPWGIWHWLMLLSPSVVALVIPRVIRGSQDVFVQVIGPLLCIILGHKLSWYLGNEGVFGWLLCCLGVTAANFAIFFAACTMSFM